MNLVFAKTYLVYLNLSATAITEENLVSTLVHLKMPNFVSKIHNERIILWVNRFVALKARSRLYTACMCDRNIWTLVERSEILLGGYRLKILFRRLLDHVVVEEIKPKEVRWQKQ